MTNPVSMVLVQVQMPRGVLHVLHGGDFSAAKTWVKEQFVALPARYSVAKWKTPSDCDYWLSKERGVKVEMPTPKGPVAMKFVAEMPL